MTGNRDTCNYLRRAVGRCRLYGYKREKRYAEKTGGIGRSGCRRNGITVRNHRRRRKEIQTDIKTEAKLKEVLGSDFNANMTVADVKKVTAPEGAKFPLKITFAMKGVTASSKVQILHYDAEKAAWEKIDTTVADGTVTGTFSSLSPVAFVVDKTTLTSATGTATSPATSATTVSAVAVLGLAAVAAAFGLKKKAVR